MLLREIAETKISAAHLRKILDTIPTLASCNLPDGSNEFLNQRWHDYTGGWGSCRGSFGPEPRMPWSRRSLGVALPDLLQSRLNSRRILSDINTSSASRSHGRDAPSARERAPHDKNVGVPHVARSRR